MPNFKEFEVVLFTMNPSKSDTNWYLDSGVTSYVIRDLRKFAEMKHIVGINSVSFVVGQSHKVHGKGTVVTAHSEEIKMKNVLYVPGVKKNLLSVGAIANMGYVVIFSPISVGLCQKRYPHRIIVEGMKDTVNGLYRLVSIGSPRDVSQKREDVLLRERNINFDLWHIRFGHIGFQGLHELSKAEISTRMPYVPVVSKECDHCVLGK
jgi:hypothetical protein